MTGEQLIIDRNVPDRISGGIVYDKPEVQISKNKAFEVYKEASMPLVLDLISQLGKNKEIILKAEGDSIANAVTVANILTNNHLEGESKNEGILDGHQIHESSGLKSTIEMVIKITNP
ncbi:MAG: hypothetical protein OEM79_07035 [Nitrosopumilus sp.]|nr:hypothetical protein [Nitrosopumilus sp.]